ncbi:UbiA prenyltransferase family-domain-containing protein [Xylaria curta]|nr:UbiA prenyltransferase family-domain-containing protein [Xylaria curta]
MPLKYTVKSPQDNDTPRRRSILHHIYSVWLFTRSDLKTIVIPATLSGVFNTIFLFLNVENQFEVRWTQVPRQAIVALFWVWINLLPFNIDNQRRAEAIVEDMLNKPWRTMPSGRMTAMEAKILMFCLYVTALYISMRIGGTKQCLTLMLLGFMYNELRLADRNWFSRNVINALGFYCFTSGALDVSLLSSAQVIPAARIQVFLWLIVSGAVVLTTVQMQDMADQAGDDMRHRKTMPLSLGDSTTRWVTAVLVLIWSVLCPRFWSLGIGLSLSFGAFGSLISYRTLSFRSVLADERTFLLWNIWIAMVYSFPLLSVISKMTTLL